MDDEGIFEVVLTLAPLELHPYDDVWSWIFCFCLLIFAVIDLFIIF